VTYIIAEPCIDIKDKSCIDVCPVDCIHEFERILIIDPEECIDCGACEPECPVEAIFPEDAQPEKWEPFVKINYALPIRRRSMLSPTSTPSRTTSTTSRLFSRTCSGGCGACD
jgi:ferredoxin